MNSLNKYIKRHEEGVPASKTEEFLSKKAEEYIQNHKDVSDSKIEEYLYSKDVLIESMKRQFVSQITPGELNMNRKYNPEESHESVNISPNYIDNGKIDRTKICHELYSKHEDIRQTARKNALTIIYAATGGIPFN